VDYLAISEGAENNQQMLWIFEHLRNGLPVSLAVAASFASLCADALKAITTSETKRLNNLIGTSTLVNIRTLFVTGVHISTCLLAPVRTVPPEILHRIFALCIDSASEFVEFEAGRIRYNSTAVALGAVCYRWRCVSRHMSIQFGDRLVISVQPSARRFPATERMGERLASRVPKQMHTVLADLLVRSGSIPLDVDINVCDVVNPATGRLMYTIASDELNGCIDLLFRESRRWISFKLSLLDGIYDSSVAFARLARLEGNLPILESLCIADSYHEFPPSDSTCNIFLKQIPSLHTLRLLYLDTPTITVDASRILFLTLEEIHDWSTAIASLPAFVRLQSLSLVQEDWDANLEQRWPPVTISTRNIKLTYSKFAFVLYALSALHMPNLSSAFLVGHRGIDDGVLAPVAISTIGFHEIPMLYIPPTTLTMLTVHSWTRQHTSVFELTRVLRSLPSLTDCSLSNCDEMHETLQAMNRFRERLLSSENHNPLLPRLLRLELLILPRPASMDHPGDAPIFPIVFDMLMSRRSSSSRLAPLERAEVNIPFEVFPAELVYTLSVLKASGLSVDVVGQTGNVSVTEDLD